MPNFKYICSMPTITPGWLQLDNFGFRKWSTFTTTFPGPGWVRVFSVDCACPDINPPIVDCDVFLNQGANLILLKELNAATLLATAPQEYTDIAIIGNKLYGRRFTGFLDEWEIGTNDLTLLNENIFNIGTGRALGSDSTYLIYDHYATGEVRRVVPGVWAPQTFTGIPPQVMQGDLMVLGDKVAFTTFDDISTLKIWENDLATVEVQEFEIRDTTNTIIQNVYGIFQKDSKLYILTDTGRYYSMLDEIPVRFMYEGQASHSGTFYNNWNGAAQRGNCGTITPPEEAIPLEVIINNSDEIPTMELIDVTIGSALSDILTNATFAIPTSYSGSAANSAPSYNFEFTLGFDTPPQTLQVIMSLDGGADTIVDTVSLDPGDTYSNSFNPSPTTSIIYKLVLSTTL